MLWIAFILYLWNIENSFSEEVMLRPYVVNCFHFVSLKYWKQSRVINWSSSGSCELLSFCIFEILKTVILIFFPLVGCCELLSFCIFEILKTVRLSWASSITGLWIAFILYLWNIENSRLAPIETCFIVVNCFHFVSLKYWKQ